MFAAAEPAIAAVTEAAGEIAADTTFLQSIQNWYAAMSESGSLLARMLMLVINLAIILLLAFICRRAANLLINVLFKNRFAAEYVKAATLNSLLKSIAKYVIYFFAIFSILSLFGVSSESILAVASIGTVAIGFAAQSIVKDIINGAFILFEDHFNIGDEITVGLRTGKVVSMGLRTTKLEDANGDLHIIPNSEITVITRKAKPAPEAKETGDDK